MPVAKGGVKDAVNSTNFYLDLVLFVAKIFTCYHYFK